MKLIVDSENSHPTTITVKGKEITLLLIESSILIDSSQIAKIFDKKEKTVTTKVQKFKLEKSIVDSWATSNSLLVNINDSVRLITQDELTNNLKLKISGGANAVYVSGYEVSPISWTQTLYWTLSNSSAVSAAFIPDTGAGSAGVGAGQPGGYIRPVIEIQKSSAIVKK